MVPTVSMTASSYLCVTIRRDCSALVPRPEDFSTRMVLPGVKVKVLTFREGGR